MTQSERRIYLIEKLLAEQPRYSGIKIPKDTGGQRDLLRSLMNVREPRPIDNDFIRVQDEYLRERLNEKGITDIRDMEPVGEDIYIWQGDITTLKCDGIVNAANSGMTGCYYPCHGCIDNCIHTFAGIQLRLECNEIIEGQGHNEPLGKAKITKAYNLPCKYVLHTVGPVVSGRPTLNDCDMLESCYISCLELAEKNNLESIAFCCISTGEFHSPNDKAAEIAVNTVKEYKNNSKIKVIFNVFKYRDREIYNILLGAEKQNKGKA